LYALSAICVAPFIVGATAGPVVYPTSPFTVVPATVFVKVLERMPYVPAVPRGALVAANTLINPTKPNVDAIANTAIETLLNFFIMFFHY
jgi:hypothetical protein